jgi:hypothetical protein
MVELAQGCTVKAPRACPSLICGGPARQSPASQRWPCSACPWRDHLCARRVWLRVGAGLGALGADTNGNGKVDEYTEPGQPAQAGKDMRIAGSGPYAVMPHPADGSIWYTMNVFAGTPGFLRFDPKTKLSEFYAIPKEGIGVRGGDIDKNGVVWGVRLERHSDQLRPAQVQGAAQRANCDRQPLSRRLRLLQVPRAGLRRVRERERRGELLHVGGSAQHSGAWRECPNFNRQPQ